MKIAPSDIDTSQHFLDCFDKMEREISARYIVRMCQERGSWESFTLEDINDFYTRNGSGDGFWFNGLVCAKYGIRKDNDQYIIEQAFIKRLPWKEGVM